METERERAVVAVTGATGLIGRTLIRSLRGDGWRVVRVLRSERGAEPGDIVWDAERGAPDAARFAGVSAVVHLAGEPIAQRWSAAVKARIRSSRADATRQLATALASLADRPRALISASAVGIYGDRGDELLTEESAPGTDFLSEVARAWEHALEPAGAAGIRTVSLRFGLILARDGGALERMLPAFRLGAGGRLGSGAHWWSWVAMDDVIAVITRAITDERMRGAVNVVAPNPVTNARFTEVLGHVLGRPTLVAVPELALKLAFGEMAGAVLLASQRVQPRRLESAGYRFRYTDLEQALRAAV